MKSLNIKIIGIGAILLLLLVFVAVTEWMLNTFLYVPGSVYRSIHDYVIQIQEEPEYIPMPYQNYINNPDLKYPDGRYNNNAGLRLSYEVNLNKPDSVFRILFLGGSTTYGCLVHDTDSYVHRLGVILNEQLPSLNLKYKKVECLNG